MGNKHGLPIIYYPNTNTWYKNGDHQSDVILLRADKLFAGIGTQVYDEPVGIINKIVITNCGIVIHTHGKIFICWKIINIGADLYDNTSRYKYWCKKIYNMGNHQMQLRYVISDWRLRHKTMCMLV